MEETSVLLPTTHESHIHVWKCLSWDIIFFYDKNENTIRSSFWLGSRCLCAYEYVYGYGCTRTLTRTWYLELVPVRLRLRTARHGIRTRYDTINRNIVLVRVQVIYFTTSIDAFAAQRNLETLQFTTDIIRCIESDSRISDQSDTITKNGSYHTFRVHQETNPQTTVVGQSRSWCGASVVRCLSSNFMAANR